MQLYYMNHCSNIVRRFFSCLTEKWWPHAWLPVPHMPLLKGASQTIELIITFRKPNKFTRATADAKIVALLTKCTCYVAVLTRKLFRSWGTCCFLVLHSFNNFLAVRADVSETLISWAIRLRDFFGEASSLAPILSNLSSVSTVRFLCGFLSSSDPVLFSLLTKLCILCLLGTGSPGNWHRNFLRHFPADSYLKYSSTKHTRCSIVYLTRAMLLQHWMVDWKMHYQKQTRRFMAEVS